MDVSEIFDLPREICEKCRKKLDKHNCTLIMDICDDCLADKAADNRQADWENGSGYEY